MPRLSDSSRASSKSQLLNFQSWLREQEFSQTLDDTAEFQDKASGRDRYRIVDAGANWVKSLGGTHETMLTRYATARSFF